MYEVIITDMETEKRQVFKCDVVLCVTSRDEEEPFGRFINGTIKGPTTLENANKLWKHFYKSVRKDEKKNKKTTA